MISRIKAVLREKGYQIFERPFELNIIGVRSTETNAGRFDDEIHVFYKDKRDRWNYHVFKATTDPGTFWLEHPLSYQGTAILKAGQYLNTYRIGLHQGKYLALVQGAPVTVARDYDRNAVLDFFSPVSQKGYFGINIHKAFLYKGKKEVDKNSAGCQVFEDQREFSFFMRLAQIHSRLYGNSFSYTLLDMREIRRKTVTRWVTGIGLFLLSAFGLYKTYQAMTKDDR